MKHRFLTAIPMMAMFTAVVLLMNIPAAGQAPAPIGKAAPAAKTWTPARTPDGQPDLQGFWTNSTYTPFERPNGVTKEFYSPEEVVHLEKEAAERETEQTTPGTIADVHYDFTQFGLDRNQSKFASNVRTSMIIDPPNGKLPPVNAEGQNRAAERAAQRKKMGANTDAVQNLPVGTRCIVMAGSGPPMMPTGYNSNYQIVQAAGYVMILTEMIHDARIIPLDGREHAPHNIRQWIGDSRGHWEGDTLVIETTNFNDKNPFRGASQNMKVTERLTRVDADNIDYRFTVEDPATWDVPWTAQLPMKKSVGPIFEHACHEGNYGVANTLAGARAEDKRAAEAATQNGSK
jgi:hypothetical protein